MNIVYNKHRVTNFGELKVGDTFCPDEREEGPNVYIEDVLFIKAAFIEYDMNNTPLFPKKYAVNLKTGTCTRFEDSQLVIAILAEINVLGDVL